MAPGRARLALLLTAGALAAGLLAAPAASTAAPVPAQRATARASDGVIDILVLGDSYSAGNGATDDAGAVQSYGPDGCRRSRVNWSEKYAAALRASGQAVRVVNHACSGGVTADFTNPRALDTSSKQEATPAGVTTTDQANAYLRQSDPCNTQAFPNEEFWTYAATMVTPYLAYDCTRNLRPQVDFVTPDVDLLLFTMGGNDAGFSSIVSNCFVPGLRMAAACKDKVESARALLPTIRQRLLAGISAIRAHGLRGDAKIVQLGYPWLQLDSGFTLTDTSTYDAGTQVRALVTEGDDAIAGIVPTVNAPVTGQMSFLAGVPQKFSGHEPDATTPIGNGSRWINQVADGDAIEVWYHPNRLGQIAYADLLRAQGTFGAPTGPGSGPTVIGKRAVKAKIRAKVVRSTTGGKRLRIKVTLSDGSRAHGRLVVKVGGRTVAKTKIGKRNRGKVFLPVHATNGRVRIVYRDRTAPLKRIKRRLR